MFVNHLNKNTFNFIFIYHLIYILIFFLFAKNNDTDSIKYFTDSFNNMISGKYFYFGGNFVKKISSVLINTFNFDFISLNLFFGLLGTIGILILASIAEKRIKSNNIFFYAIILILCVPTFNFFTSHMGKDSLIFFSICLFIWSVDDFTKIKFFTLIIAIYILVSTRLHLSIPILFIFFLFFPLISNNFTSKIKLPYYVSFLCLTLFALFYSNEILLKAGIISELGGMSVNPKLFDYNYVFQKMAVYSNNTSSADSTYKSIHDNNLIYYFKYLFGPYMHESFFGLKYLVVKFESIFYFLLIVFLLYLTALNKNNEKLFFNNFTIILIFIALTIPLSLSVSNYGISIRQRITIYPFLIYMLILNIEYLLNEKKITFNSFKISNS